MNPHGIINRLTAVSSSKNCLPQKIQFSIAQGKVDNTFKQNVIVFFVYKN